MTRSSSRIRWSVRASLLSDESVVCNSSASAPGIVSVEVSTNGRDFSASGVLYERVSVLVSDVSPWSGPELGGTLVTLRGEGFVSDGIECRGGKGGGKPDRAQGQGQLDGLEAALEAANKYLAEHS